MSNYKSWNIQQLITEQINISAEIHARVKCALDMEDSFETYNSKGTDTDYRLVMQTALDIVRKGQGE